MTAQLILNLDTIEEFSQILQLLKGLGWEHKIQIKTMPPQYKSPEMKPRQAGWGKDLFPYVAPDFDDTPACFDFN
jgi:hypothetical protein